MSLKSDTIESPWPHRLAMVLVCATFPLIWVGGLVTSYEAGMAVPDWPGTYGYNMFLYPWQTWLFGPFDILVEHGHRLLGATVGLLTLALLVSAWVARAPWWLMRTCLVALALVVFQGVLGGLRVIFDERDLAKLHGCTGPVFFALTVVIAALTSRRWQQTTRVDDSHAGNLQRLTVLTTGLAYLQIVLGAQLRHFTPGGDAGLFRVMLVFHLLGALLVVVHAVLTWNRVRRDFTTHAWLQRPAFMLVLLLGAQVALGASTWIVNYGWPVWFRNYPWAAEFVVRQESFLQALVTTAHVALGSLIVATSALLTARSFRSVRYPAVTASIGSLSLGVTL